MNITNKQVITDYARGIMQVAVDSSQKSINEVTVSYIQGYMEATLTDLLMTMDLTADQIAIVERNLIVRQNQLKGR